MESKTKEKDESIEDIFMRFAILKDLKRFLSELKVGLALLLALQHF